MSVVVPVILAAGDSRRMGFPKALLPLEDSTFLGRIHDTLRALRTPPPVVVLGKSAARIQPHLPAGVRFAVNPDPDRGQISSLLLGIEQLDPDCEGCLVWPVDQPFVPRELVAELLRLFATSAAPIVLPFCEGRRGHPAIFGRAVFRELLEAGPSGNPKLVVRRYHSSTAILETEERSTIDDIDTPEDYLRWTGKDLEAALRQRR